MVLDPSMFGTQGDASVPLDQFTATYDDAIRNADSQVSDAKSRYMQAQSRLQAIDPNKITNQDALKSAQDEMAKAATVVEQASAAASRARELKGSAIERYSQRGNISPELRQRYSAMAAVESANAQKILAENFEFLNAIPEKRDQLHAATQTAQAGADLARAQADVAGAATPFAKQEAQARADAATQAVKNAKATEDQIRTGTRLAGAQADIAGAQAAVAPQAAQAAVDQATANVNKSNLEIADLQRQARQAPTDAQAQQAIQTQISQKQTELQAAQLQLQQAQKLMPLAVAGAEQNLQRNTLGTLYGLPERIKAIADGFRSGQIPSTAENLAKAQQDLQDYITATVRGTTPYEQQKTALDAETTRRGQDYSLANTQTNALGSFGGSALGDMLKVNRDAPAGSTAMAQSYGGLMSAMMGAFQSMRPNVPMDSPLLKSMANVPAPVAPTTTIAPDGSVTIQHTPSTAPTAAGLLPPGAAGTGADPNVAGSPALPAMLANMSSPLATHDHVDALWANDPNLNPRGAPVSSGAQVTY